MWYPQDDEAKSSAPQRAVRYIQTVSNLKVGSEDFPAAAEKMLRDAQTLLHARRYDGAAYLAGYTVECSLKTVLLLEAYAQSVGAQTVAELNLHLAKASPAAHDKAFQGMKTISHKLGLALDLALKKKPSPTPLFFASTVTRRYLRGTWPRLSVLRWRPEMRYQPEGQMRAKKARRWVGASGAILAATVTTMRADFVVTG